MKQLSKESSEAHKLLVDKLESARQELNACIVEYNNFIAESQIIRNVIESQRAYSRVVHEANSLVKQVYNQIDAFIDSKPEDWQDTKVGQQYLAWLRLYERCWMEAGFIRDLPRELDQLEHTIHEFYFKTLPEKLGDVKVV